MGTRTRTKLLLGDSSHVSDPYCSTLKMPASLTLYCRTHPSRRRRPRVGWGRDRQVIATVSVA